MKDNGTYEIAYVIARVAEPIQWSTISDTVDGVKHTRVSVFFESFIRNNKAEKLQKEIEAMKTDIELLKNILGAQALRKD